MEGVTELAQYGAVGIALAVIVALVLIVRTIMGQNKSKDEMIEKLVTNHDQHLLDVVDRNTEAWTKTATVLNKVIDKL